MGSLFHVDYADLSPDEHVDRYDSKILVERASNSKRSKLAHISANFARVLFIFALFSSNMGSCFNVACE